MSNPVLEVSTAEPLTRRMPPIVAYAANAAETATVFIRALRLLVTCLVFSYLLAAAMLRALGGDKCNLWIGLGRYMTRVLASCGGALPKFGQILSTRPDLLPPGMCAELSVLQDRMPELSSKALAKALREVHRTGGIASIRLQPEASGTIAQVHRAVPIGGGPEVALKIKRPDVDARIAHDCYLAEGLFPLLQNLPSLRSIPIRDAVQNASIALRGQTDLRREAESLDRFRRDLSGIPGVFVPASHPELSSGSVLAMQYVAGLRKITDPEVPEQQARELVRLGLQCLYHMIFVTGFIHCDLHPGNLMVDVKGCLVLLDAGLVTELDHYTRTSFAQFFAAIALQNGRRAAEIVRSTAFAVPSDMDCERFDGEIAELVVRAGGLSAQHFEVASFVGELFAIQERHGMRGTSRFSLIILALLVYEGTAKQRFNALDFQKEAIPFIMDSLFVRPQSA